MDALIDKLNYINGYRYQIWHYNLSHSTLTLRATTKLKDQHNIHIIFSNVQYFQFPFNWEGDLYPAPDNELLQILVQIGVGRLDKVLPIADIKERFSLYKADSPNGTIYILGHLAEIEYDVEPIYN